MNFIFWTFSQFSVIECSSDENCEQKLMLKRNENTFEMFINWISFSFCEMKN